MNYSLPACLQPHNEDETRFHSHDVKDLVAKRHVHHVFAWETAQASVHRPRLTPHSSFCASNLFPLLGSYGWRRFEAPLPRSPQLCCPGVFVSDNLTSGMIKPLTVLLPAEIDVRHADVLHELGEIRHRMLRSRKPERNPVRGAQTPHT